MSIYVNKRIYIYIYIYIPIVSDNYAISPDGTQNAQRIQFDLGGGTTTSDRTIIRQNVGAQSDWFLSVWMKSTNGTEQKILWHTTADSNETVVTGEWQRFTFSRNGVSNSWAGLSLRGSVSDVDTADILVYGFQIEQGSYPTSYIPTQGSAVTRVADVCNQTVPDGVIGQTEGTVFLDSKMALQSINNYELFSINNGGVSDRIRILTATGNRLRFIYQLDGGALAYSFYNPTDYSDLTNLKIAFTYKSGDIKVYINGVLVDSSTNTFTIAEKLIDVDISSISGGYSQMFFNDIKLYNTALTDQELQALTTI